MLSSTEPAFRTPNKTGLKGLNCWVMKELISDELWGVVEPLLPVVKPRPRGGRPRKANRDVLRGILFVLRSGIYPGRCCPGSWAVVAA